MYSDGEFEAGYRAGNFKPSAVIEIARLFPDLPGLAKDPDISVRDLQFDASDIVVVLKTNDPLKDLRLTLGHSLEVKAARQVASTCATHPVPWMNR